MEKAHYSFTWATMLTSILLLFTLLACQESDVSLYTQLTESKAIVCSVQEIAPTPMDSMHILLPNESYTVNYNVPFKKHNNSLHIVTNENVLLEYDISGVPVLKRSIQLPTYVDGIRDCQQLNDASIIVCYGNTFVINYNPQSRHVDTLFNKGEFVYNFFPYIGYTPFLFKEDIVLPFNAIPDVEKGSFLTAYTQEFNPVQAIGNAEYNKQPCKRPYYDTPILSSISANGDFWATYSSESRVTKCRLKDDYTIEYGSAYAWPNELSDNGCIPEEDLYDYKVVGDLYVTSEYWARLESTGDKLFRIKKLAQDFVDNETNKKNIVLNSAWELHVLNTSENTITKRIFGAKSFMYFSGFMHNGAYYVPKQSTSNTIVLYAFN